MLLEYGSRMLLKKIDALCGRTRRLEKHISLVLLALNSNLCESANRLQILNSVIFHAHAQSALVRKWYAQRVYINYLKVTII